MTTPTIYLRAARRADQVASKAAAADPRRAALVLAMLIPFALGWLVGTTIKTVWLVGAWLWSAAVVGYQAATENAKTPRRGGG